MIAREAPALLARVLRGGRSLCAEYPLVFRSGTPGRVLALEEEGRVLSACTLLERVLVCGGARVPFGMLGSVATEQAARGRGLAARVLEAGVAECAGRGLPFVLLWADEPSYYERRGWSAVGSELDLVLPREALARLPAPRGAVRAARAEDALALWALEAEATPRVERSARELRWMLATPGLSTLLLERGGKPVAWSALGRGADFRGVVHDGAGAPEDRLALAGALAAGASADDPSADGLVMIAPASSARAYLPLLPHGATAAVGHLALARLADPDAALALVARALPQARTGRDGDGFLLRGPRGTARVDERLLLCLLLPPKGELAEHERLADATGLAAERLALDAFVGGLDSI